MKLTTQERIVELISLAKANNLYEMAWGEGDVKISFRRNVSPKKKNVAQAKTAAVPSEPVLPSNEVIIKSPIVGTFRRGLSKDRPPVVLEGTKVKVGDRLGVVECMKIPTDVTALSSGVIKKVLVDEGGRVEYGQPLFVLELVDGELANEGEN